METIKINVRLSGLRPMMFDRYAGDNNTQLPASEKMYLDSQHRLTIPSLNLYSLLVAENTKSVCKLFFGKQGRTVALGISAFTEITPYEILVEDDNGPIIFSGFNEQVKTHKSVARLKGGIPNPKDRPMLSLPWHLGFDVLYQENRHCTLENLRQAIQMGGILGIGSFRPFFGRYQLKDWKENREEE